MPLVRVPACLTFSGLSNHHRVTSIDSAAKRPSFETEFHARRTHRRRFAGLALAAEHTLGLDLHIVENGGLHRVRARARASDSRAACVSEIFWRNSRSRKAMFEPTTSASVASGIG